MFDRILNRLLAVSDTLIVDSQPTRLSRRLTRRTFAALLGGAVVGMALPSSASAAACECTQQGDCDGDCEPNEAAGCSMIIFPPFVIEGGASHCWCQAGSGGDGGEGGGDDELWTRICDCTCGEEDCTCSVTGSKDVCTGGGGGGGAN